MLFEASHPSLPFRLTMLRSHLALISPARLIDGPPFRSIEGRGLPVHHDGNMACCGVDYKIHARELTVLVYLIAEGVRGGHIVFPFLHASGEGLGRLFRTERSALWEEWRRDIYRKELLDKKRDQFGHFSNATLGGIAAAQCAQLVEDDRRGEPASAFGFRPVAGDAVIFWQKNRDATTSDPHAFHAACDVLDGTKLGIQKFMQRGGTPTHPPEVVSRGLRTLDPIRTPKGYCEK